jgi:hypothetical protein
MKQKKHVYALPSPDEQRRLDRPGGDEVVIVEMVHS